MENQVSSGMTCGFMGAYGDNAALHKGANERGKQPEICSV